MVKVEASNEQDTVYSFRLLLEKKFTHLTMITQLKSHRERTIKYWARVPLPTLKLFENNTK